MKKFGTKCALTALYCVIAVDGYIDESEKAKFDEIALQFDSDFLQYKDGFIADCKFSGDSGELSELVQEYLDRAINDDTADDKPITSRMLIWNMLVMAYSDGEYADVERRLIGHTARIIGVESSVVLEMDQILQTLMAVEREKNVLEGSDRPYMEIKELVDNLNERIAYISASATHLIDDEIEQAEAYVVKRSAAAEKISEIGGKVGNAASNAASRISQVAGPAANNAAEKVSRATEVAAANVGVLFGKIGNSIKKNKPVSGKEE